MEKQYVKLHNNSQTAVFAISNKGAGGAALLASANIANIGKALHKNQLSTKCRQLKRLIHFLRNNKNNRYLS